MKKLYALVAFAFLAIGANAQQQIPNSGFENWSNPFGFGEDPDGYVSLDFLADNVTKSTDAHTDSFSARFATVYAPADTTVLQDSLGNPIDTTITENSTTAMIILGSMDLSTFAIVPGVAFADQPTAIRFWVKGNVAADDTAAVVVGFTKWNSGTSTADEIGGSFGLIVGSFPGWTQIEAPIDYAIAVAPDTMIVIVASTINEHAHGDTEIFIDDLELVYTPSSVAEVNKYNVSLYPNPSNGLVSINGNDLNDCVVSVSDITGRVVSTAVASNNNIQVEIANAGLYLVTATKPNGEVVLRKKVTVQ